MSTSNISTTPTGKDDVERVIKRLTEARAGGVERLLRHIADDGEPVGAKIANLYYRVPWLLRSQANGARRLACYPGWSARPSPPPGTFGLVQRACPGQLLTPLTRSRSSRSPLGYWSATTPLTPLWTPSKRSSTAARVARLSSAPSPSTE